MRKEVDWESILKLSLLLHPYPACKSFPVRYGKLNIIVCMDAETYFLWKEGKDLLIKEAPVDRDRAKEIFRLLGVSAK